MPKAFAGLYLALLCFFIPGSCLHFKATEHALYTRFTGRGLRNFFSLIPPSEKKYHNLARLFRSRSFYFRTYYSTSIKPKELDFIGHNLHSLPPRYIAQVRQLQKNEYGKAWLLKNLHRLTATDLRLDFIKPKLFTLEQQKDLLTFALKHQRPFIWNEDFCTIFPDSSVFDHEWLWLYLDPFCFHSLPEKRRPQVIEILQRKAAEKETSPAATLFLILIKEPMDWERVCIEQPELRHLLQKYEKACENKTQHDELWKLYELFTPHFKDFPLGGHSAASLHALILFNNYLSDDKSKDYDNITSFMNTYSPRDLNCYLVIAICEELTERNKLLNTTFKLPSSWREEMLKNYVDYIPGDFLHYNSQLEEWRRTTMALTLDEVPEPKDNASYVYSNASRDGMLAVEYHAKRINQLSNEGYLRLSPSLKFDCEKLKNNRKIISDFWIAEIYQAAINGTSLPKLEKEFEDAISKDSTKLDEFEQGFGGLTSAVCLNSSRASFKVAKTIIISTKKILNNFGLGFYYDFRTNVAIFEQ